MSRRLLVGAVLVLAFVIGGVYAWRLAFIPGAKLLFNSAWPLVLLAPFAGILAAGLTRRRDPVIEGDRVLRHDDAAILEHWTHGVGTAALLLTGLMLGFLFIPRMVSSPQAGWAVMNVHFVAVLFFLFGTFYYGTNTLLAWQRFREHLPTANAITFTKQHYGRLFGMKYDFPMEDKYFESEKLAYVIAVTTTALMVVTGMLKVAAHVADIPGSVMGPMTLLHDVAAMALLAFFAVHVLMAAVLPIGWPMLRSMFTGYVSADYAKREHPGWYRRLPKAPHELPAEPAQPERVARVGTGSGSGVA